MNIVFCYPTPFNPTRGGVERVSFLLAKEFVARGHKLFFLHNKRKEDISFPFDVVVDYFPDENYDTLRNKSWFENYLDVNTIDVVVNHCGCFDDSKLYCHLNGVAKSVSILHMSPGVNYDCLFSEISRVRVDQGRMAPIKRIARVLLYPLIKRRMFRERQDHYGWLSKNSDAVVMLTQRFKPEMDKFCDEFKYLIAIGNPLSFAIDRSNKKENCVIWVGRMEPQKRPDLMIKIWQQINSAGWRLIMIGDGSLLSETKQSARYLDNVEFVGSVDSLPYFKTAKILCMTSGHEGFGMVLTEAQSQGCVPMAFKSFEAVHDIIRDENQLATWHNTKEYSQKLSSIMKDEARRLQLVGQGYEIASEFECHRVVDKWETLFNRLLSK